MSPSTVNGNKKCSAAKGNNLVHRPWAQYPTARTPTGKLFGEKLWSCSGAIITFRSPKCPAAMYVGKTYSLRPKRALAGIQRAQEFLLLEKGGPRVIHYPSSICYPFYMDRYRSLCLSSVYWANKSFQNQIRYREKQDDAVLFSLSGGSELDVGKASKQTHHSLVID